MKIVLAILLVPSFAFAQDNTRSNGPLIFLSGKAPITSSANGAGVSIKGVAVGSGTASTGGEDETMKIAMDLLKKCPEVSLTVGEDSKPDYILLVNRTPDSFMSGSNSQFMLLRPDKSILYANEKSSAMKASKDACKAVLSDWRRARSTVAHTQQQNNLPAPAIDGWWKMAKTGQPSEAQK
jgi:hypothetical protein